MTLKPIPGTPPGAPIPEFPSGDTPPKAPLAADAPLPQPVTPIRRELGVFSLAQKRGHGTDILVVTLYADGSLSLIPGIGYEWELPSIAAQRLLAVWGGGEGEFDYMFRVGDMRASWSPEGFIAIFRYPLGETFDGQLRSFFASRREAMRAANAILRAMALGMQK